MTESTQETLLEFPCDFPIKAFGIASDGFPALVLGIVRRHAPNVGLESLDSRPSSGGKYQSVTVTIRAESKAQIDAIYQDLTDCAEVIMAL